MQKVNNGIRLIFLKLNFIPDPPPPPFIHHNEKNNKPFLKKTSCQVQRTLASDSVVSRFQNCGQLSVGVHLSVGDHHTQWRASIMSNKLFWHVLSCELYMMARKLSRLPQNIRFFFLLRGGVSRYICIY